MEGILGLCPSLDSWSLSTGSLRFGPVLDPVAAASGSRLSSVSSTVPVHVCAWNANLLACDVRV